MKTILALLVALAAALLLPGCAASGNASEREWQRAQCGQIIDKEAGEKCMKRVDEEYGKR
jgi:hypothetical protein